MARRDNAPAKRRTNRELTGNQKEWLHQVQNLKRRIKSLEGLGAVVEYPVPTQMPTTSSGKIRVERKHIEELKSITRKELEKYAKQVGEFGELVPFQAPERGKTKERREQVKREREEADHFPEGEYTGTDIVDVELDRLRDYIENFDENVKNKGVQEYTRNALLSILDKAIAEQGRLNVARTAEEYSSLHSLAEAALWQSRQEKADMNIRGFSSVLLGRPFTYDEAKEIESVYETAGKFA